MLGCTEKDIRHEALASAAHIIFFSCTSWGGDPMAALSPCRHWLLRPMAWDSQLVTMRSMLPEPTRLPVRLRDLVSRRQTTQQALYSASQLIVIVTS